MKRILFVCTGNTCRSPMAEAVLKNIAEEEELEIEVKSAGLSAWTGSEASRHAQAALHEKGIDIRDHQSTPLGQKLVDWADLIFPMTQSHKQMIMVQFPHAVDRIFCLKEYAYHTEEYEQLMKEMDQLQVEIQQLRALIKARSDRKDTDENQSLEAQLESSLQIERDLINRCDQYTFNQDVHDPFGGTLKEYRACLQDLATAIRTMIEKWKREDA